MWHLYLKLYRQANKDIGKYCCLNCCYQFGKYNNSNLTFYILRFTFSQIKLFKNKYRVADYYLIYVYNETLNLIFSTVKERSKFRSIKFISLCKGQNKNISIVCYITFSITNKCRMLVCQIWSRSGRSTANKNRFYRAKRSLQFGKFNFRLYEWALR